MDFKTVRRYVAVLSNWNCLILICEAMLAMTGRVTMLGIARWTEKGGSYRTLPPTLFLRKNRLGKTTTIK
jgi:hypothetical protein